MLAPQLLLAHLLLLLVLFQLPMHLTASLAVAGVYIQARLLALHLHEANIAIPPRHRLCLGGGIGVCPESCKCHHIRPAICHALTWSLQHHTEHRNKPPLQF